MNFARGSIGIEDLCMDIKRFDATPDGAGRVGIDFIGGTGTGFGNGRNGGVDGKG